MFCVGIMVIFVYDMNGETHLKNREMYKVTTIIDGSIEQFNAMEEVNDHIKSQIKWFNSPSENEKNNGYTVDDFIIE